MQGKADFFTIIRTYKLWRSFLLDLVIQRVHCVILYCFIIVNIIPPLNRLVTSVPTVIAGTDIANELDNTQWDANSVVPPQHTVVGSHKASVQNITFVTTAH